MNLWEVWKQTVAAGPRQIAGIDSSTGESFSRSYLYSISEELARDFPPLSGQVVALAESNGIGWLKAFLALQKAGAVPLPLEPGSPEPLLTAIARKHGASFLFAYGRLTALASPASPNRDKNGEEVCLLKVTSGTSNAPRLIPFTTPQMLADGRQVCAGMGIQPGDVSFGAIPFGHSYGLGNLVLPLIAQGTAVAYTAESFPGDIAAGIARSRATVFPAVPVMLYALGESASVETGALQGLKTVISAGAFLRPAVAIRFYEKFRRKVHSFYGSSETGGITFDTEGEATITARSVGFPLPSVQIHFEAPDEGRIHVASPAVASPGCYLLEDRGKWNSVGELCLLGRSGRVANIGGRKIDPAEVESALRQIPQVMDAWVGIRTRLGGDDYLVGAAETCLSRSEIMTLLSLSISPWQIPRQLVTLTLFPRSPRGKLIPSELEIHLQGGP